MANMTTVHPPALVRRGSWIYCPLLGAAALFLLRLIAAWVAGLEWAPFQGVFELAAAGADPWGTLVAVLVGALIGIGFAGLLAQERLMVRVDGDEAVLFSGRAAREFPRSGIGSVFVERGHLDPRTREEDRLLPLRGAQLQGRTRLSEEAGAGAVPGVLRPLERVDGGGGRRPVALVRLVRVPVLGEALRRERHALSSRGAGGDVTCPVTVGSASADPYRYEGASPERAAPREDGEPRPGSTGGPPPNFRPVTARPVDAREPPRWITVARVRPTAPGTVRSAQAVTGTDAPVTARRLHRKAAKSP